MTTRRDHRQTHVRPRPPSTGRPAPVKVKPRSPGPTRIASHRAVQRPGGLPVYWRIALVFGVVFLGALVLYVGVGGVGMVARGVSSTLGGFVTDVTSTPSPRATIALVADSPSLAQPEEPYTALGTVDLVVTVPPGLVGSTDHRIKVYLTLPDQPPTAITEVEIAEGAKTVIPVELTKGINDFSVSIVGPGGESDPSAVVRYVFDDAPPKITITSPKNNGVVNGKAVSIKGKTQARTTLLARNDANGSSIAGTAGADGTFDLSLALATGVNKITITGTDPAGNEAEATLTVRRGSGKLTASLTSSTYRIKKSAAAGAGHPVGDRDRSGRQGARRRRHHVHPEHPGHPDRHRRRQDERERQGVVQDDHPQGRRRGPGERHRPGHDRTSSGRPRTSRSSPSPEPGETSRRHSQLPSGHADVAMSALRDTPGRDGEMLGLPSLQHRLRVLSALPPVRRRPGRLLRARS